MKRVINSKKVCSHGTEWIMCRVIQTSEGPQVYGFAMFITKENLLHGGRKAFADQLRRARRLLATEIRGIRQAPPKGQQ